MPVPANPQVGDTFTQTGTAVNEDGSTNTEAVVTWETTDPTVLSFTDSGSNSGVGMAVFTAVAEGTAQGTAVATNADGTTVATGDGNPFSVTVTVAVNDATAVNVA